MPFLLKPLAIIGFYFFRLRRGNQPTVGYQRPETLNLISADKVPNAVLEKFAPFFRRCVDADFTLQFFFANSGVGSGTTTFFSAVLLDVTRVVSAVTVCEFGQSGETVISKGSY